MTAIELSHQIAVLRSTLQSFTRRFTSDREESHDLVQDTMLRALTYRDKFRENTNLKGWLFIIMRNTFINNYRKNKRIRTMDTPLGRFIFESTEDEYTFNRPQERMEFKEIWENVNALRKELAVPFKMFCTGYKYNEIAKQLDMPIGTVKSRIFHARKEIQKSLHGY